MYKSYHEKYKGHSIVRGSFGNGSYNVYNTLGHFVGNAESKNKARRMIDCKQP